MNGVKIIRNPAKLTCVFTEYFKNFEKVEAVQQIFGEKTSDALSSLEVVFTDATIYMRVDYEGRLLINPEYLVSGDFADLYLDIIHELVHVHQVMNGKNCNHALPYVERPLELEAYQTAVDEARVLGWDEPRILEYLDSDLINSEELKQLASSLGVDYEEDMLPECND
jgi:hypothetical protein